MVGSAFVFTARGYVGSEPSEVFFNVYLSEDIGGNHLYLSLQRPKPELNEPDELYLEVNNQLFSCLDGVTGVELHRSHLVAHLSLRGQRALRLGETVAVALALSAADFEALRQDLRAVLTGLCPFTDRAA